MVTDAGIARRGLTKAQLEAVRKARVKARSQWKQCLATFTNEDPVIGPVTIERGDSMPPDHIAVTMHPDKFGPDGSVRVGGCGQRAALATATRTLAPATKPKPQARSGAWRNEIPAWRIGHEVELHERMPAKPTPVSLTSSARADIEAVLRTAGDGETGGLLFGPRYFSWYPAMRVHAAYGPGVLARRRYGSLNPDDFHDAEIERAHKATWPNQIRQGYLHSHPEPGEGTPSDEDLSVFEAMALAANVDRFLALIASPDRERGWRRPVLTPWVIRLNATMTGRTVCERATLR